MQKNPRMKLDWFEGEIRQEDYPVKIPPRSKNPIQLDITDLERIARFKRVYGGALNDACFEKGIVNNVLDHAIKPLFAGMVICGRVLPVKWHSLPPEIHLSEEEINKRYDLWKREGSPQMNMHRAIFPGSVLVFDNGGDEQAAIFGEMSCNLAKSRGCVGVVNNGLTRDTRYVTKIEDFAYYTRGTTPNSYGGWRVLETNVPIYLPGHLTHYVMISPGDFIFGDSDGLQIIPKDHVDEVLLKVEEIFGFEEEERRQIVAGMPIDQVYTEFGDL